VIGFPATKLMETVENGFRIQILRIVNIAGC